MLRVTLDVATNPIYFSCRLAKVAEARLDGDEVVGLYSGTVFNPRDPVRICEEFANIKNDQEILAFTKKYAPVSAKNDPALTHGTPLPGSRFRISLAHWRTQQEFFRHLWTSRRSEGGENYLGIVAQGDAIVLSSKGNRFEFHDFNRLLTFWVSALSNQDRRTCERPGCGNLFAADGNKKKAYCSKECVHWARKKTKLEYWNRTKEKHLALRGESR